MIKVQNYFMPTNISLMLLIPFALTIPTIFLLITDPFSISLILSSFENYICEIIEFMTFIDYFFY